MRARAIVTILNWNVAETVDVDLAAVEEEGMLEDGTTLRITSVQNTDESVERTYSGNPVAFPMTGWTPTLPAGRDTGSPLPSTFPELGAFIVEWETEGEPAPRGPVREPDPGKDLPSQAAHAVRLAAWRVSDPEERTELLAQRRAAWRARTAGRSV
jgi:hypothetical protein